MYGLQILDATLEAGNTEEEDTAGSALLLKHEFLDGGADDVTLATLGEVLLEPTLTTLGNFLVRSNSQSSVASASFTVGGFRVRAPQGPRACGGPARVADGQAVGRALRGAPPHAGAPGGAVLPVLSSSELVARKAPTYRWRSVRWQDSRSRRTRLWRVSPWQLA